MAGERPSGDPAIPVVETGAEGTGLTVADKVGLPVGATAVDGNPARFGLGDAAAELERDLQAADIPGLVAGAFIERVTALADEPGVSPELRTERLAAVMRDIGLVREAILDQIKRAATHVPYTAVQNKASEPARLRLEAEARKYEQEHPEMCVAATC